MNAVACNTPHCRVMRRWTERGGCEGATSYKPNALAINARQHLVIDWRKSTAALSFKADIGITFMSGRFGSRRGIRTPREPPFVPASRPCASRVAQENISRNGIRPERAKTRSPGVSAGCRPEHGLPASGSAAPARVLDPHLIVEFAVDGQRVVDEQLMAGRDIG